MNASVDKLTTAQATDLDTTKGRELREVAKEARDRERAAMAADRVADAAMYREIADRAEHVADREAKVRYASEILPAERARVERVKHPSSNWEKASLASGPVKSLAKVFPFPTLRI